ncbi:Co-chaperone, partial [Massospora cicadina]
TSSDGVEAEGRITIPEVAHDTNPSDYIFEITVDADSRTKDPIRQVVRSCLSVEIKKVFASFAKDLIDSHSKDVYIDPTQLGGPSAQNPSVSSSIDQLEPTMKSVAASSEVEDVKTSSAPINTCTLKDSVEFVASAADIYQALTDPTMVSIWTRAPAALSKEIGSSFSLFGGNIQGTVKELVIFPFLFAL